MKTSILLILSILTLCVAQGVYPVYECYNTYDQYCKIYWAFLNCNPGTVTADYQVTDANNAVITSGSFSVPSGFVYGNQQVGQGYCLDEYTMTGHPSPITLTMWGPDGVHHSSSWDGCTSTGTSCSPAGDDCFLSQHMAPPPPCPATSPPPPTTPAPPPTTLPSCGSCPCQCP